VQCYLYSHVRLVPDATNQPRLNASSRQAGKCRPLQQDDPSAKQDGDGQERQRDNHGGERSHLAVPGLLRVQVQGRDATQHAGQVKDRSGPMAGRPKAATRKFHRSSEHIAVRNCEAGERRKVVIAFQRQGGVSDTKQRRRPTQKSEQPGPAQKDDVQACNQEDVNGPEEEWKQAIRGSKTCERNPDR
jgi:hypothetical protein